MTSFEKPDRAEIPCATCPNRSKLSRALADIGLFAASENCPGTDVLERFDVVRKAGSPLPYDEYPEGIIRFGAPLGESPKQSVGYFATKSVHEEPCPRDPIVLAADETVMEVRINDSGKARIKTGKGDSEAIEHFMRPAGWNPAVTDGRPPREILDSIRFIEDSPEP